MPTETLPFEIRAPWDPEGPILRRLLPSVANAPALHQFRIAIAEGGRVAGAAAWCPAEQDASRLAIQVLPAFRRLGLGSALLHHVVGHCSGAVEAIVSRLTEPEAVQFLQARGFERISTFTTVGGPLRGWREAVGQGIEKTQLPPHITIQRLAPQERHLITPLWSRYIALNERFVEFPLAQLLVPSSDNVELVRENGNPVAFFAWRRRGNDTSVEAWAAEPAFRRTRGNVAVLITMFRSWMEQGVENTYFSWNQEAGETAKLAQRFPCEVVAIRDGYRLRR